MKGFDRATDSHARRSLSGEIFSHRAAVIADAWIIVLAVILLWPLWRHGYPLGRDMVFTPHQPLTAASFGLGSASPRAVPLDALVAIVSRVLDGAVIGRAALILPLVAAGFGCSRLVAVPIQLRATGRGTADQTSARQGGIAAGATLLGRLAAGGFAVWNPYVVERLALGQWALLWAYGALPWIVWCAASVRARDASRLAWAAAVVSLAAASITPTGGLIGAAVFLACALRRSARQALLAVVAALLVQLPWLIPAITASAGGTSDPAGVASFASRAENHGGVLLSLVGLGGIWDSGSAPASRAGIFGYLTCLVVVIVLALGGAELLSRFDRTLGLRLAGVAVAGFGLAALTALPGGAAALRWAVATLPGAGLLRDGQKWLAPFAILVALCLGGAITRLARSAQSAVVGIALMGLAIPVLLLPDAIATLRPTLTPATYPAGWYRAADAVHGSGAVLVLPFASYRRFEWVSSTSVIDPAPRWLRAPVIVDDRLVVDGVALRGEDRTAAQLARVLSADAGKPRQLATDLAAAGVGWVWVELGTPGPDLPDLSALSPASAPGEAVALYRVPGPIAVKRPALGREWAVVLGDLAAALVVVLAVGECAVRVVRSCYTRR